MENTETNKTLNDLMQKNNRLSADLLFAQKCIQFLEKFRNCLISFDNNCKCDQNIDNKNVFKLLKDEYKCVFNDYSKQLDSYNEYKLECNETDVQNILCYYEFKNQTNFVQNNVSKDLLEKHEVSEKRNTSVECKEDMNSGNNQLIENNNNIDDCDENQNSIIDNQFNNDSSDETNNDNNHNINDIIMKNIRKRKKGYHEMTINEILKKIEEKEVVIEIDKNEPLMKVLRAKHRSNGNRTLYGYSCNFDNICQYISGKRIRVLNHINSIHTLQKTFNCDECDFKTIQKEYLSNHKKSQHDLNPTKYKCDYNECEFETKNKANLKEHKKRVHEKAVKPHSCVWPACGMSFYMPKELKNHMTVHSESRPYQCEWPGCEASFKRDKHLRDHSLIHTGEKPIKCDWPGCEAAFAVSSYLRMHKLTHTGVKKHVCNWPQCGKSFRGPYELKIHSLRIHSNDKPIRCLFTGCDYRFIKKSEMLRHFETHKKAVCDGPKCGQIFRTFGELDKHCLEAPKGDHYYKCPFEGCERTYKKRNAQMTHFLLSHKK